MKKSLFKRLIRTYVGVILLSILIIGLLFTVFFVQYFFNAKEHQLLFQGRAMSLVIGPHFTNEEWTQIESIVTQYNRVNLSHMWVVDRSGQIISGDDGFGRSDELCPESDFMFTLEIDHQVPGN